LQSAPSMQLFSVASQTPSGGTYGSLTIPGAATQVFDGAADSGFVLGANRPLGLIGVNVSTAATGGTFEVQQWNGTAWDASDSTLEVATAYASGEQYNVVKIDVDAVRGGDASLMAAGGSDLKYYTRIITTGALSGPVEVDDLWAMSFLEIREGIVDNGQVVIQYDWRQPFLLDAGEGAGAYFSAASNDNQFGCFFTTAG